LVVVAALVDTTGRVARTIVKESDRSFDESAVLAVEQWRFRPARNSKGRPVAVWVAVPMRFSMH
jgi:TonB family protein